MTEECKITMNTGLRGVTIASTRISDVDGDAGKLIYRGYLVKDLAENASFEEVAYLLLFERMPKAEELAAFKKTLVGRMPIPSEIIDALKTRPRDALPMDILQAGVAMLAHHDPDVRVEGSRDAAIRMGIRLIAGLPTLVAAWDRLRNGRAPVAPLPELGHAANFLYMMSGRIPDEEAASFFDACLVLHAEHSFNASTFAAREVASTRAHMYAAVGAAVGSLSGALHGGANTRVMQMLKEIDTVENIDAYIEKQLGSGGKIMGLGHAVYKVDDPRALILAPMSRRMGERIGEVKWYEISRRLEEKAKAAFKRHKDMDIYVNVDFYSASLYYAMGIAMDLFTPIFAISRVAGWAAHVLEEQFAGAAPKPMLYRPESEYIGDYCGPEACAWEPIDRR
ncbi:MULTISPECIES: citrate/2-methylcitrate synthase [Desulfococcus]|uniref:Citrate synthase n=1 Tax=Desulfococcus multivorans DSM 2059 TaxID=1121405 RepID=S7TRC5_DESML|nr:citrate/2-methylcitrate synthase [Desulfococcus multivorans]AOY60289.1 GltA2: citrate synthase [Desulfococcus multivorans]AQV02399.1 citrate (Si)-synthase [Desulfococcus multivorans]EPR39215.1 Citrate synthase [Desulfococcus multivorans DSM 2059]SJZ57938.1 citrate synthase [Desulfococcus multivorans DSM 2059]